jgi:nucleotide-binding universal stress UspA family protein
MESKKGLKYMVCHDGSDSSNKALQAVKMNILRDSDNLMVAHVWNRKKEEYLDYKLKRQYIKELTESECAGLGARFHYHDEELMPSHEPMTSAKTAKNLLNEISKDNDASVVVVGFHGRKGPKADPTVMGSAVQYLSVETFKPVLIIKDPKSLEEHHKSGLRFAACVDGSRKSLAALEMICEMKSTHDKITVIICEQPNIDSAKVKGISQHMLEEKGCLQDTKIEILKSEYGRKPADIIRDCL